ncbi:MAG: AAA family ATPase [Phycisphaerae bacterium]|nr:AAA family ATPase [Phycisphaerae bacterium]
MTAPATALHHTPFVLGHAKARLALSAAIRSGHVHHAWILHGPPGVGKMRTAEAFARLLLDPDATPACVNDFQPPAESDVAHRIDAGTHADYHVIRKELAALSDSRELRERKQLNIPLGLLRERMLGGVDGDGRLHESAVFRTATHGHGKVFILDEAELLDADAQNAMLRTLEEPPPGTFIILVTSREDRLLPTIRSRCQRVPFGPLDDATMRAWWQRSGLEVADADRPFIEQFAEGSPGMAQRAVQMGLAAWNAELSPLFDQLESGDFPAGLGDRLAELVDDLAKGVVDDDEHASKDAANRLGTRLLSRWLGLRVRRALAAAGDEVPALERALATQEVLEQFEQHVRSNVNLKHAFGNLVAQWGDCTRAA